MIEVYEDSSSPEPNMYCSLHCRTVLKNNETAAKSGNLHHFLSLNDCMLPNEHKYQKCIYFFK